MKILLIALITTFLIINITAQNTPTQSYFEKGLEYYNKRSENSTNLIADSENIVKAIKFFKKAVYNSKDLKEEIASVYLLKALFFEADYTGKSKSQSEEIYFFAACFGDKQLEKFPRSTELIGLQISHYGMWASSKPKLKAAKEGVAGKLKTLADSLYALDKEKGSRILGILHYRTPYIPLFLRWPSNKKAQELLEESLCLNPNNFASIFYYAKVLEEKGQRVKAISVLKNWITYSSNKNTLEGKKDLFEAEELLKEFEIISSAINQSTIY